MNPSTGQNPGGHRLHHVGFVVRSIDKVVKRYADTLGLVWDGKVFHDPIQTVRVTFLYHPGSEQTQPALELVEPESDESRVAKFLKKGGGMHHLCYEVESLDGWVAHIEAIGGLVVQTPVPAVAFDGRKIAWVYTREMLLVEYLQRG